SLLVQGTAFNVQGGPFVAPGFIGSDALLNVSASNVSSDGFLDAEVGILGGGHVGGNANLSFNIAGGIAAAGPTDLVGGMTFFVGGSAGTIGGDAAITVNAASIASQAFLFFAVSDANGGNNGGATSSPGSHITGDATIDVRGATGINAGNGAFFAIVNEDTGSGTFGGTIDGNALVHVTADHLSTEALAPSDFNLFGTIHNRGGRIVGNSDVMFDIAGAIKTAGIASIDSLNLVASG